MELIQLKDFEQLIFKEDVVGVIGQFDGLHLGHLKLINEAKAKANSLKIKTALITFDPHPDYVLGKRANYGYITPFFQKQVLIEEIGVDIMVIINFTLNLSKLSPLMFYKQFLASLKWIYVGSDYRYGFRGEGSVDTLKELHQNVVGVEVLKYHNEKISSSDLRNLISTGQVDQLYTYMKRYYNITGKVRHGNKVGRLLGIRTANLDLIGDYQIIKKGVYAVIVQIDDKKYLGVCNIGHNPTLNYTKKQRLEVHIIDFDGDLYDKIISVDFVKFLREEIPFKNKEDLIQQINLDISNTITMFGDLL